MRSPLIRVAVLGSFAALTLTLPSVAAATGTSLGQVDPTNGVACDRGPATVLQTGSSSPSFTVPGNGVITSVTLGGDPGAPAPRGFRLARGSGSTWTVVGRTATVVVPAAQTVTESVRIPARAGDVLGEYVADNATSCLVPAGTADELTVYYSDLPDGQPTASAATGPDFRIPVAAVLEADRDGDGYGDDTQDACPTDATTHGSCVFRPGAVGAPRGRARVGQRLTAPVVSGLPAGTAMTFQWYRSVPGRAHGAYRAISGAHGSHYRPSARDRHARLLVRIGLSAPSYTPTTVSSRPVRIR